MLSDPWSFLILREVFRGRRTFSEFRDALGIATDVLAARLQALVESGVLTRVPYHRPGDRAREAYEPTPAGVDLKLPLVALMQWGEAHTRGEGSPGTVITDAAGGSVRAVFTDPAGTDVPVTEVEFRPVRVESAETAAITDDAHGIDAHGADAHGGALDAD